jgi:hypothetical protein
MTAINMTLAPRQALWLRRIALGGFWFFLGKGLLWLAAPLVFYFFI